MRLALKRMEIRSFKGIRETAVDFGQRTRISGRNGAGKTTLATAIMWTLFNQDYGLNTNPNIRPIGAEESLPEVTLTLDVDGREVTLTKRQKERRTESDGNVRVALTNQYEVNSVAKPEKAFKEYLSGLGFDFDVALSCMHPDFFTGQTEKGGKAMRNVLFRMASKRTDLQIARAGSDTAAVAELLEKGYTLDEIDSMHKAGRKKAAERQEAIPNLIVGMEQAKVGHDVGALEKEKSAFDEQLAEVGKMVESGTNKAEIDRLEQERFDIQFEINDRKRELLGDFHRAKDEAEEACREREKEISKLAMEISVAKAVLNGKREALADFKDEKSKLADDYRAISAEKFEGEIDFDESKWAEPDGKCPYCGQDLPKDKMDALMEDFEGRKTEAMKSAERSFEDRKAAFAADREARLNAVRKRGFALKHEMDKLEADAAKTEQRVAEMEAERLKKESELKELKVEAKKYANEPVVADDEKYKSLMLEDAKLARRIQELKDGEPDFGALDAKMAEIRAELKDVEAKLAQAAHDAEIDAKIEDLRKEQRQCEQAKADAERVLYQLDVLSRRKNDLLTDEINSHFKSVRWQLFEYQKNGNYKECCKATMDGKRFGESANKALEIAGKLDICESLQRHFDMWAPIVLDDAEHVNGENMPKLDAQLIELRVTDDEELVIESEG